MKVLSVTLIGAIVSAIILGGGGAVIGIVEDTPGAFFGNSGRDVWLLTLILGALFGAGIGGIEAFFVSYLQIRILWTILFGLAVGLIFLIELLTFGISELGDENYQMFVPLFVIWQVIYPTTVSLISVSPNNVD